MGISLSKFHQFNGHYFSLGLFTGLAFVLLTQIATASIRRIPENITELYFTNHQDLPKVIDPDLEYSFMFSVESSEDATSHYDYVVVAVNGENVELLGAGTVFVPGGDVKTVKQQFRLKSYKSPTKIIVGLTDLEQVIHFWTSTETETIEV